MKKILFLLIGVFCLIILGFSCAPAKGNETEEFKSGDIIFIVNPAGQGKAIQLATKSVYTHVGLIYRENGKLFVYHAVQPVSKSTINDFIHMSKGGRYVVKRVKNKDHTLDSASLEKMRLEATALLGKDYDIYFDWSDKEYYCSEFVWKLYKHNFGLEIGKLRPLKDFDLSSPAVKQKMEERYGKDIPLDSKMISPGDMFDSDLLELVTDHH